jgi:uncharacterized membrane protein YeaQ/YmgE (transglycosylase-associated protein family)
LAVCFGVVFGAYVAQKLRTPLGLDDDGPAWFWALSLAVMGLLACVFVAVVFLVRALRRS